MVKKILCCHLNPTLLTTNLVLDFAIRQNVVKLDAVFHTPESKHGKTDLTIFLH
jgi:hypothetical protein